MTGGTLHEKIIEDQGIEEKGKKTNWFHKEIHPTIFFTFVTFQESLKWMKQICNAVKFLHDNNIAHRDLKPTNLLLSSRGIFKFFRKLCENMLMFINNYFSLLDDDATLKLGDFGFAIQTHSPKSLDGPYGTQSYIGRSFSASLSLDEMLFQLNYH